jgi:hypothetical protein
MMAKAWTVGIVESCAEGPGEAAGRLAVVELKQIGFG